MESDRSAVPASRLVRLSGPLPEPGMRLPPHPALHEPEVGYSTVTVIHSSHGVGIAAPR